MDGSDTDLIQSMQVDIENLNSNKSYRDLLEIRSLIENGL